MSQIKPLIARLLYFLVISVLLVASCAGPSLMYYQSPWWFVDDVKPSDAGSFYVAFMWDDNEGSQQLQVKSSEFIENKRVSGVQYYMPKKLLSYDLAYGKLRADIYADTETQGSQLIRVFVVGNTPWTSLSEYRVVDNTVYPLRHARSVGWFLLGIIIFPILVTLGSKRIRRGINRLMRIGTKHNEVIE